jgi:hypothetical protein
MADITGMLQAASGTGPQYVAVGSANSPYISVYRWSDNGFGAKFNDPSTLPPSGVVSISFNPNGTAIALGTRFSPLLNVYAWSPNGFGAKYTNPVTTFGGFNVSFNPSGNVLATNEPGFSSDPARGIRAYAWSSSGFGSKYTDPVVLQSFSTGMDFHPSGNAVVVNTSTNDPITSLYAYSFSTSTGFGTLASNTTAGISGITGGPVKFHPSGNAVGYVIQTSPYNPVYAWSSSGFGTKFANPSTALPGIFGFGISDLAWSPDGNAVAFTSINDPWLLAYAWSNGYSTKYSDPGITPISPFNNPYNAVSFSPNGTAIAAVYRFSPYITVYRWSNSTGFGTKFSDPVTLPTGEGVSVAFLQA